MDAQLYDKIHIIYLKRIGKTIGNMYWHVVIISPTHQPTYAITVKFYDYLNHALASIQQIDCVRCVHFPHIHGERRWLAFAVQKHLKPCNSISKC